MQLLSWVKLMDGWMYMINKKNAFNLKYCVNSCGFKTIGPKNSELSLCSGFSADFMRNLYQCKSSDVLLCTSRSIHLKHLESLFGSKYKAQINSKQKASFRLYM